MSAATPIVNITMPVYNRYHATQRAILALRKTSQAIPFALTVVDNGSDAELVEKLKEFHKDGIIDHLYLLPENMGIACACNVGWQMLDAPFYMKLDNDTVITERDWLPKLFKLWQHGEPLSTLGGAYNEAMLLRNPGALHTPDGILGNCLTNLPGQAILIPKAVSDILGMWNEDYGLYGAEDGDYAARMICAGFPQYYYLGSEIFHDLGRDDLEETYAARNIDKHREHKDLFFTQDGLMGLFRINHVLYSGCARSWKVPLRYRIADVHVDCRVRLEPRKEYLPVQEALLECQRHISEHIRATGKPEVSLNLLESLKQLMADCGQSCDNLVNDALQTTAVRTGKMF